MTEIIRGSSAGTDENRYLYDTKFCTYAKGWAQIDTRQDASYYGTWTNPFTLEIFSYCEGDLCLTKCDTEAEYVTELRKCADWNKERDYWLGIDPGWSPENFTERFTALGVADLLH